MNKALSPLLDFNIFFNLLSHCWTFPPIGHLYLTGNIKSVKTNDTAISLKVKNTAVVEVIGGSIIIESAEIEPFSAIATGSIKLSKKLDIKLANDEVSINNFEGEFGLHSSGSADIYGKVSSMTADGQSFTVLVK